MTPSTAPPVKSLALPTSFDSTQITQTRKDLCFRAIVNLFAFVLMWSAAYTTENATLSGYVRDAKSGETLIGANVYFEDTARGTATNNSGYYILTNFAPGAYTLVVSYIGYEKFRQRLTLILGESRRVDIDLRPGSVAGRKLVVEGDREVEKPRSIGVATVTRGLVEEVPSVIEADLFRAIQLLPGIKAASDFSSGLYIRGGSPDQTLILLDRTTVYNNPRLTFPWNSRRLPSRL